MNLDYNPLVRGAQTFDNLRVCILLEIGIRTDATAVKAREWPDFLILVHTLVTSGLDTGLCQSKV